MDLDMTEITVIGNEDEKVINLSTWNCKLYITFIMQGECSFRGVGQGKKNFSTFTYFLRVT